jgi:hypothetical protein
MIYKVLNLQTLLNAILIVADGLWFTSAYIFEIKYGGPITMVWFYFSSCHPVIDSMLILYYVKPYRLYIKKKVETILMHFGWKPRQTVTVNPILAIVTSSTPHHASNIQGQIPRINIQAYN